MLFATLSNYTGAYSSRNGPTGLGCSIFDVINASIRVGHSSLFSHIFTPPFSRIFEVMYRFAMGMAYLTTSGNNIVLSPLFTELDQSEKVPITYRFGMAIAKLHSEWLLNVPTLLHFDAFSRNNIVVNSGKSSRRPDLVGLGALGDWHVVEAKGRSSTITDDDRTSAKEQATTVATINGIQPATYTAALTLLGTDRIHTEMNDPEPSGDTRLSFKLADFIKAYYAFPLQFPELPTNIPTNTVDLGREFLELDLSEFLAPFSALFPDQPIARTRIRNLRYGWDAKLLRSLTNENWELKDYFQEFSEIAPRIKEDQSAQMSDSQFFTMSLDGSYFRGIIEDSAGTSPNNM